MGKNINVRAIVLVAVLAFVALIVVNDSFYTVGAQERGVVTRFGALEGTVSPGLHFKIPVVEAVSKIDTRIQTIEWVNGEGRGDSRMESYSYDQQPAHISIKIAYQPKTDSNSITTIFVNYKNVDGIVNAALTPRTYQSVKTVFGQFDAQTVIQNRAKFDAEVDSAVRAALKDEPINIMGVQIQDISFSQAYEDAVEARMQAAVAVEKAEQDKKTAQINADMQVIRATADAQQIKLKGDAEAAAIKARSDALRDSPKLVELTAAEKWDGHLPTTMVPGGTLPFLNLSGSGHQ